MKIALVTGSLMLVSLLGSGAERPAEGRWDRRFGLPGVDGSAFSVAFNHREIYLGGYIISLGRSINDSGVGMFDGKQWKSLPPGPDQTPPLLGVMGVEGFRGRLYACGFFTNVSGKPTCGFARWNGQNWSNPAGTNGMVACLRRTREGLLVGGRFQLPGVSNLVSLARWDDRRWTVLMESGSDFSNLDNVQQCLRLANGDIIATTGTTTVRYDGAQWQPLTMPNGRTDGYGAYEVTTMAGRLVVFSSEWAGATPPHAVFLWSGTDWQKLGDDFEQILGAAGGERTLFAVHRVAPTMFFREYAVSQWTGTNWQRVGDQRFFADYARVFVGRSDDAYVTGLFLDSWPIVAPGIARWNGEQWESVLEGTYEGVSGGIQTVFAFAQHAGSAYMGGAFAAAGRLPEHGIARWDGDHWQSVGGGLIGNPGEHIRALASVGPLLYATGQFTNAGGTTVSNVAAWDGSRWSALGSGLDDRGFAVTAWSNSVVVGGRFERAGDAPAPHVAQWTGTEWRALGEGCNGSVASLLVWRNKLFAGGAFTTAGGRPASGIARWNGAEWRDVGGGVSGDDNPDDPFDPRVIVMAASERHLYAGGRFQMAGTAAATNLARWDGTNWFPLGSGLEGGSDVSVSALAVRGGKLYVGARRNVGERGPLLLCWDGKNWTQIKGITDPSAHAGSFGRINALLATRRELFVGGRFPWAGRTASASIARWIETSR